MNSLVTGGFPQTQVRGENWVWSGYERPFMNDPYELHHLPTFPKPTHIRTL